MLQPLLVKIDKLSKTTYSYMLRHLSHIFSSFHDFF